MRYLSELEICIGLIVGVVIVVFLIPRTVKPKAECLTREQWQERFCNDLAFMHNNSITEKRSFAYVAALTCPNLSKFEGFKSHLRDSPHALE